VVLFDAYPHVLGGSQRVLLQLAEHLVGGGFRPVVMAPGAGPLVDHGLTRGLDARVVAVPRALGRYGGTTTRGRKVLAVLALPRYWLKLLRTFRRLRPRVVHANDHRGVLLAGVPARLARASVVWHIHAMEESRVVTWLGSRVAERVLVPSGEVLGGVPGLAPRAPAVVAANPPPSVDVVTPSAEPVVVAVGRLHPQKGFDILLRAFVDVRAAVPGARLVIVGGGHLGTEAHERELEALAADPALAGAVELVGEVDDITPWLAKARVYVQPSRTESFGMAAAEAMASGLPVVATDVGGLRDVVDDGVTGILVPLGDEARLAAAIVEVLTAPGRAEALGAAGPDAAARKWRSGAFEDTVVRVYGELGLVARP
jgi:glycosyltransferase involved in cell wall biosynthesis